MYSLDELAEFEPQARWRGTPASHRADERETSKVPTANFIRLAREAVQGGGHAAYEWPASCDGWRQPHVQAMMDELWMRRVSFEGCCFGMRAMAGRQRGELMRKGWSVATDADELFKALEDCRCRGGHEHAAVQGADTSRSAFYPDEMCVLIHQALEMQKHVDAEARATRAAAATVEDSSDGGDHWREWTWAGPELPAGGGHRE